jgi:hypothetical protein
VTSTTTATTPVIKELIYFSINVRIISIKFVFHAVHFIVDARDVTQYPFAHFFVTCSDWVVVQ